MNTRVNTIAVDGQFVSNADVKRHPKTTYQQTIRKPAKPAKRKG